MDIIEAARIIRKELLIKDEPVKAFNLLTELNIPELKPELDRTYGLIKHAFDKKSYEKFYGMNGEFEVRNHIDIEPTVFILKADQRYDRYNWIVNEVRDLKPKSYLDFACYVGSLVTTVANMGVDATGVDITKSSIEAARERAKSVGLNCKFVLGDVDTYEGPKVDMVSAFELIEHVPDDKKFIEKLCSLSNEWVYITTPNGCYDNGDGNLGHWDWDGDDTHVRGHLRVYTKPSLFKLLDGCGCEIAFLNSMRDGLLWAKFRKVK